jgi:hypothetical protein
MLLGRLWEIVDRTARRNNRDYPVEIFHNDAHSVKCISLEERAPTHMHRSERRANMRDRLSRETVGTPPCPRLDADRSHREGAAVADQSTSVLPDDNQSGFSLEVEFVVWGRVYWKERTKCLLWSWSQQFRSIS